MLTNLKDFQVLRLDRTTDKTVEIPGTEILDNDEYLQFWDPIQTLQFKRAVFDRYYITLKNRADNEVHHFYVNVRERIIKHWIYFDRVGNPKRISSMDSRSIINLATTSAFDQRDKQTLKINLKAEFNSIFEMAEKLKSDQIRGEKWTQQQDEELAQKVYRKILLLAEPFAFVFYRWFNLDAIFQGFEKEIYAQRVSASLENMELSSLDKDFFGLFDAYKHEVQITRNTR